MKIVVTGGTGFVGRAVCKRLLERGCQVTAVGSRRSADILDHRHYKYIAADTTRHGPWQEVSAAADAVVNLTGRTIFKRWTQRYKQLLHDSRILTTRNLVDALVPSRGTRLLSTSAIGYYGAAGEQILVESSPPGDDFLARLSVEWEAEALKAQAKGLQAAVMRFGVVLGRGGEGALAKMLPVFRLGAGGPLGNGRQWFSWIHLEDLVAAVIFLLTNPTAAGAYNFCAPQPVRNRELAAALGKILNRPAIIPAPAMALKLVLGEFSQTLLSSQRVVPARLERAGFEFRFATLESALDDLV